MDATTLCFTPAVELAELIRQKQLSPVELLDTLLQRIAALNPKLNAYCTLAEEQAREAAKQAEQAIMQGASDTVGPLHGIPVSIKDLTATKGIRTTLGSKAFEHTIPKQDALLVQRLKQAGAIILGKTNTPEMGAGINTTNEIFGTTRNPWSDDVTCGGSSGGAAAALAAGLGPLAEGSDHGGSLRIPASYCGVVGFRTTPGRIPRFPTGWGWDSFSVTGPMARTVADTALMLTVMAGRDDRIPISINDPNPGFMTATKKDIKGLRIAWSPDLSIATVDPEVAAICQQAMQQLTTLGCIVEEDHIEFGDLRAIIAPLRAYRSVAVFNQLLEQGMADVANDFFKEFMALGQSISIAEAGQAEAQRYQLWLRAQQFFSDYDLLICPSTQTTAFPIDQLYPTTINGKSMPDLVESILLTYSITLLGVPAISIPAGWTQNGLPVGLQIIGNRLAENTVLSIAAALENLSPWAHLQPDLSVD